jgi:hypothetical protein
MLRRLAGRVVVAAAVATALSCVLPAPVDAVPVRHDPMEGLTVHPEWGSVTGTGGMLKRGCRKYTYSYSIDPPEGTWAIEVFITGPGLKHLAAGAFLGGYDPEIGVGHYKLCKVTTRYGRFTINVKLSVDNGYGGIAEGRLPPDHYRLHRPRPHR